MSQPLAKHQLDGIRIFQSRVLWVADSFARIEDRYGTGEPSKEKIQALAYLFTQAGQLFAWDMGAGKTRSGLYITAAWSTLAERIESARFRTFMQRPILILGEASGVHVWKTQLRLWFAGAPDNFMLPIESGAQVDAAIEAAACGEVKALSVSYSLLTRYADRFDKLNYSLLIADEVQALTNSEAKRTQALYRLSRLKEAAVPGVIFKIGLSGTPFTNRVADLWPVISFLQGVPKARKVKGELVYHMVSGNWGNRTQFVDQFTVKDSGSLRGQNIVHDPRLYVGCNYHMAEDCPNLHPRMTRLIMHRVTAAEAWPNLPSVGLDWIETELPASQQELYDTLISELVIPTVDEQGNQGQTKEIERLALMTYAFEALASGRQLQYSLRDKPETKLSFGAEESGILDKVRELCDEIPEDESVVIFTGYEQFARQIAERLGDMKPILLAGSTGNAEQAERDFQDASLGHRAFVATTRGIKAITLTKARYCIIAGFLSYSPWDILQAIYRIRRPGQKADRLMVYALTVEGTLLAWLRGRLAQKLESGLQVLDGRVGGAEVLNIQDMTKKQFLDAFKGK